MWSTYLTSPVVDYPTLDPVQLHYPWSTVEDPVPRDPPLSLGSLNPPLGTSVEVFRSTLLVLGAVVSSGQPWGRGGGDRDLGTRSVCWRD